MSREEEWMRPLLILACSATKRRPRDPVSAYELYDGPAYRVLRASSWPGPEGPDCRVMILSAEHGLISAWHDIEHYDRRMDEARAAELSIVHDEDALMWDLFGRFLRDSRRDEWAEQFPTSEVFVWGGGLYRQVVRALESVGVFDNCPRGVTYSSGGIGVQLAQLKAWLAARTERRAMAHAAVHAREQARDAEEGR